MADKDQRELARDRDDARGAVRLGWLALPVAIDLPGEVELSLVCVLQADVAPGECQEFGDPGTRERRDCEERAPRLLRRHDCLLELRTLEDPAPLDLRWLGSFRAEHQRHRVGSAPPKTSGCEAVYPVHDADHDRSGRLREPAGAQVAHQLGQIVRTDRIQADAAEAWRKVAVDGVSVTLDGPRTKVSHGAVEPRLGGVGETESRPRSGQLTTMTLREQLVARCSRGSDATFDGPPPLFASGVLESDLEHTGRTLVNVALDAGSSSHAGIALHDDA
jgi:hypothetical protein